MFERILQRLRGESVAAAMPPADALHLTGALLVRVAQADATWHLGEVQAIDRILARMAQTGPVGAARLRADCERLAATLPPTGDLAGLLAGAINESDKADLLANLHLVAIADGVDHPAEQALIAQVARLLGVPSPPA